MAVLRRITAVVTLLATLLLVLTESGFACSGAAMPGMGPVAASATDSGGMAGMAGMAGIAGMPMTGAPSDDGPGGHHERAPSREPCRFPWAPSGCRDMAPCAPAALTVASTSSAERTPRPAVILVARVTAPASVEAPPEPPPPRA